MQTLCPDTMQLALSGFRQRIYNRIELVASEKNVGDTKNHNEMEANLPMDGSNK